MADETADGGAVAPGYYRHYKGGEYYVAGVARHSERRDEWEVVYYSLAKRQWNRRPLRSPPGTPPEARYGWLEPVAKDGYSGPRFVLRAAAAFGPPRLPDAVLEALGRFVRTAEGYYQIHPGLLARLLEGDPAAVRAAAAVAGRPCGG